jgi:hypothetical protein
MMGGEKMALLTLQERGMGAGSSARLREYMNGVLAFYCCVRVNKDNKY